MAMVFRWLAANAARDRGYRSRSGRVLGGDLSQEDERVTADSEGDDAVGQLAGNVGHGSCSCVPCRRVGFGVPLTEGK